jgi:hypothetical protein
MIKGLGLALACLFAGVITWVIVANRRWTLQSRFTVNQLELQQGAGVQLSRGCWTKCLFHIGVPALTAYRIVDECSA